MLSVLLKHNIPLLCLYLKFGLWSTESLWHTCMHMYPLYVAHIFADFAGIQLQFVTCCSDSPPVVSAFAVTYPGGRVEMHDVTLLSRISCSGLSFYLPFLSPLSFVYLVMLLCLEILMQMVNFPDIFPENSPIFFINWQAFLHGCYWPADGS